MSAQAQVRLTVEQYLALERQAEFKSEFYDGQMYAMSGGTYRHARIIGNLTIELGSQLRKGPCAVNPTELRVKAGTLFTYPDVTVVCEEPKFVDGERDTLLNPTFVAEVLSPSTERHDRGMKAMQYRSIDSLMEYALVSQDEARVEVYTRQADGKWLLSEAVGPEAQCEFPALGCQVALGDLYAKVEWGTAAEA